MDRQCDVWRAASGPGARDPTWTQALGPVRPLQLRRCRRVVVATTHLGEATAGAGGFVAALVQGGATVDVLAVTGGDGAPEGSLESASSAELHRRGGRQSTACRHLGIARVLGFTRVRVHRLELRSGKVPDGEPDVVAALSELLGYDGDLPSAICLAPWQRDGHPDHDAVGRAAELACHAYRTRLFRYLVMAWRWAQPSTCVDARPYCRCPSGDRAAQAGGTHRAAAAHRAATRTAGDRPRLTGRAGVPGPPDRSAVPITPESSRCRPSRSAS